jgi:signal transduction histidine kinase
VPGSGGGGYLGIAQDVTDRHALAREMTERTQELATTREERAALRQFVSLVIQAQEDERARIAGDLHDTSVQTLTAIARRLRSLADGPDAGPLAADLGLLADAAQAEAGELRRLSRNLRPSVLDNLGLAAGLEQLAEDLRLDGLSVSLAVRGDPGRLPDHARTGLFRIAQEALTNVRRHAAAHHVALALDVDEARALLRVQDVGQGFDVGDRERLGTEGGLGLMGMRERAAILGGHVELVSAPGQGTRLTAWLPLPDGTGPAGG